jgi:DNA-binding PadR family transcriptional regulator
MLSPWSERIGNVDGRNHTTEGIGTLRNLIYWLAERFGSACYAQGTARQAIKRLVDEGLARAVGERRMASGGARVTIYEATPAGVEHFQQWMWTSVSTPPVREELHAKIAPCRPADLPRMVAVSSREKWDRWILADRGHRREWARVFA